MTKEKSRLAGHFLLAAILLLPIGFDLWDRFGLPRLHLAFLMLMPLVAGALMAHKTAMEEMITRRFPGRALLLTYAVIGLLIGLFFEIAFASTGRYGGLVLFVARPLLLAALGLGFGLLQRLVYRSLKDAPSAGEAAGTSAPGAT